MKTMEINDTSDLTDDTLAPLAQSTEIHIVIGLSCGQGHGFLFIKRGSHH